MIERAASFCCLLLAAAAAGAAGEREISARYELGREQRLRLELPAGELQVEGGDGNRVEVRIELRCRWQREACREALESAELHADESRRRLRIELAGLPRWQTAEVQIEARARIPAGAAAEIDLGTGELEVRGLTGDLRVDQGIGEVSVWVDRGRAGVVAIDVGVGEAELFGPGKRVEGRRSLLVGSEVFWDEGEGEARIDIELGVGEATVWLD